ncbi:NU4M oxidoreductase, partial [Acromyrmex charruanus]
MLKFIIIIIFINFIIIFNNMIIFYCNLMIQYYIRVGCTYYSVILVMLRFWILDLIFIYLNKFSKLKLIIFVNILMILVIFFILIDLILFYLIFKIDFYFFLIIYWGGIPERLRAGYYMKIYIKIKYGYIIFRVGIIDRIIVRILCLVQIDIKSIVAYSSVVHINLILCRLITFFKVRISGGYVMIISHRLCSSGIFYIVNLYYERLLFLNKGIVSNLPTVIIW